MHFNDIVNAPASLPPGLLAASSAPLLKAYPPAWGFGKTTSAFRWRPLRNCRHFACFHVFFTPIAVAFACVAHALL